MAGCNRCLHLFIFHPLPKNGFLFIDLVPEQLHAWRLQKLALLMSLAPFMPKLLAQYESPAGVPGFILYPEAPKCIVRPFTVTWYFFPFLVLRVTL